MLSLSSLGKQISYYKAIIKTGIWQFIPQRQFGQFSNNIVPPSPPLWSDSTSDIEKKTTELLKLEKDHDDYVAGLTEPTVETLIKKFSEWENSRIGLINELTFYQHVLPDSAIRNASTAAQSKIDSAAIESGLRVDVFKNIKKVYEANKDNTELDPETQRYIHKLYLSYKRNGLELDEAGRKKVEELLKELSELSIKFNKNLGEQTEFVSFTKEELAGLPQDVLNQFEVVDGKYKVTFKYPDIVPTLKYAQNPETRKAAFIADQNKVPENAELLKKTVKKRAELAQLLGYKTYSDYILEVRMAKNSETVMNFEYDLQKKLTDKGEKEVAKMKELKVADLKSHGYKVGKDEPYYIWDHSYYNNKLLQEQYKVNEQKIAEYFPLQATIKKMLGFYEKLFSLKFVEETDNKKVWHEDVQQIGVYKVDDPETPIFMGWIYFDLHPRDGKYGHAAEFSIRPGFVDQKTKKRSRPVCALVCNFSKPSKAKPSLLKHSEVTTFFHELGHGIHDLMSETYYARFHGTCGSWDFVEAPSQMLEYWTWAPEQLKQLSSHYVSGDPLDDSLIKSLVGSKQVNGGLAKLRQIFFGLFDMKIHHSDGNADVDRAWNQMKEEIILMSIGGVNTTGYGSFGHMMGGYASGYYGYLYSEVFATDIYYTLFKADPMNSANGVRYRDIILKAGGSRDEQDTLKELLGREPNSDAFLEEIGVKK